MELHLRRKNITLQDHFFTELHYKHFPCLPVFFFLSKELRARPATWSANLCHFHFQNPLVFGYQQKGWGLWEWSWEWYCARYCMHVIFYQCVASDCRRAVWYLSIWPKTQSISAINCTFHNYNWNLLLCGMLKIQTFRIKYYLFTL